MHFVIDRKPQAQARHRHKWNGHHTITFDPDSGDKKKVQWDILNQMNAKGLKRLAKAPIALEVINYTQIPRSLSLKRRKALEGQPCITKPDIDNYCKFVMDAMNGVVYEDDSCVTSLWSEKIYSANPRVELILKPYGVIMINEHAITVKGEVTLEELNYLVKKANRLGAQGRTIVRVYAQEDNEGKHIYYEVEGLKGVSHEVQD